MFDGALHQSGLTVERFENVIQNDGALEARRSSSDFHLRESNRTYNGYRIRLTFLSAVPMYGTARRGICPMSDVTAIIDAINDGDADAPAQLLPLVYDELRRLAHISWLKSLPGRRFSQQRWSMKRTFACSVNLST